MLVSAVLACRQNNLNSAIQGSVLRCSVAGDRAVLAIADCGESFARDGSLLLQEMQNRGCPCCGEFPVAREFLCESATDRYVVGVTFDLNILVDGNFEDVADLLQNLDSCGLEDGLP